MSLWIRFSALSCLTLLIACAGKDDGDGGRLLSNEEERVCAWLDQVSPVVDEIVEMEALGIFGPGPGSTAELADLRRRINQASPPTIQDLQASSAIRSFHESLGERLDAVVECSELFERMNMGSLFFGSDDIEDTFEEVGLSGNRIAVRARALVELISQDLADHQQSRTALISMANTAGQLSNSGDPLSGMLNLTGASGQRTLPSQLGSGSTTNQYQRFIPPGTVPQP